MVVEAPAAGLRPPCGLISGPSGVTLGGNLAFKELVATLERLLGQPVLDRTGIRDKVDIVLRYDMTPYLPPGSRLPAETNAGAPSLFTAVREQLGLTLQPARVPLEFFVVEQVERPTAN